MFGKFRREAEEKIRSLAEQEGITLEPVFTLPTVPRFGDLSTNVCFQLAKTLRKPPAEIAEMLAEKITATGLIADVQAEAGYINFYINYTVFAKEFLEGIGPDFGRGEKKEKVIVEHTSANPDGPLHIGHLRNAVIGDTLARILKFAGHVVEVHYYLNDMGKQAAKVVWGRRRYGIPEGKADHATAKVYIRASSEIEEQDLDSEVSEILTQYEAREKEAVAEFEQAVEYCLTGIKETLARLGIHHDKFVWESSFVLDGSVESVIERLSKSGFAKSEEGALLIDLTKYGIEKDMVIVRGDGTSLYIARDLAHHAWKMSLGRAVNVWGADHKLVSMQLSAGLDLLGLPAPEFIIHEFISLPQGGMSTRKGVFISADELVDETVEKALEEIGMRRTELGESDAKVIAEDIGVSAVRFNIVRIAPEKSMVFKWDEALDFERQGAPFVQYAFARAKKILSKIEEKKSFDACIQGNIEVEERELIKTLSRFPEIVEGAALSRKVSIMATYAIELSNAFHSFYMSAKVLGSEKEGFRLSIVKAFTNVQGSVMDLLGIKRLNEM